MAHLLIAGTTESGKTLLARSLVADWRRRGYAVLVLDPVRASWPGATFVTDDPEAYMDEVEAWRDCLLVVDEAGEAIGRYAGAMATLATRSRHAGHSAVFLVQRPALLDRTVRDQCRHACIFAVSSYDAKVLDAEFPQAGLGAAVDLPQFHYLWASRFGGPARCGFVKIEKRPILTVDNPEGAVQYSKMDTGDEGERPAGDDDAADAAEV